MTISTFLNRFRTSINLQLFLGQVISASNSRFAVFPEVNYIILQIRTTKDGSIKQCELLIEVYFTAVIYWSQF